jgi:hypothetical protein
MRGNPPKVTEAQRLEILRVYKTEGVKAAEALCVSLNLSPRYYSALASNRGVSVRKRKPLTPAQKAKMLATVQRDDSYDYRWKWAVERGPVFAP